jgi:hypothetical protein
VRSPFDWEGKRGLSAGSKRRGEIRDDGFAAVFALPPVAES